MSVAALARQRVHRMKRGIPFSISGFYSLGSRASVQQAMSRLVKEGLLVRIERGFYSRPKPLKNLPSVNVSPAPMPLPQHGKRTRLQNHPSGAGSRLPAGAAKRRHRLNVSTGQTALRESSVSAMS